MLREGAAHHSDWPPQRRLWPINFPFLFVERRSLPPLCPRSSALRSGLRASRGRARRFLSRPKRLFDPMGPQGPCGNLVSGLSEAGSVCLYAGVSSGDMVAYAFFFSHIRTEARSLCAGCPVPPVCPKISLLPLTRGDPARWSPGAPPPLGSQDADWPASQPFPHHAPLRVVKPSELFQDSVCGWGETRPARAWGLRSYTIRPLRQSEGARVVTFCYLSVRPNLSLAILTGGETVT